MSVAVENEFKFTRTKAIDVVRTLQMMRDFLKDHGIEYKEKTKRSTDEYYDSEGLELYDSNCSLRKKVSENGKIKLTAKSLRSNEMEMMSRTEVEVPSDGSFRETVEFAAKQFPSVVIEKEPVISLNTQRTAFDYLDGSGIKLSFDSCEYFRDYRSTVFYEIEVESMDDAVKWDFDEIDVCSFIRDGLGFDPVVTSKYQRGVLWLKSTAFF